ncbi:hypothetical protein [Pseudoalteromonas maricaloris]|uniref:Uncharacterized protein n=1 Tax=Pseudoalteromonas maricaloris TaxID=184924 RepID=A0A8I2KP20_9GAMM|nr:hypothetical protein [Pseudoalteromonas maricaloris]NLR24409.1 hypothetical protein [Pseudoalteromonas maricaloris]WOX28495.1 hypothetical protein R5H13_18040 [Pseudoalteromonas maricaloris]
MVIKITDCHFENNGTGIKAPTSAKIDMSGTSFKGNGKAMDIYVSAADLNQLGLPENTPQEYLQEVIQILQGQKGQSEEVQVAAISDSSLFKWLGHAASVSSIASGIIAFVQRL